MSKKLFVRLLVALSFLAAAVFFFLSVLEIEPFTEFSASWAGVIFAGVSGLALLFGAIGTKNSTQLKKIIWLPSAVKQAQVSSSASISHGSIWAMTVMHCRRACQSRRLSISRWFRAFLRDDFFFGIL